MVDVRPFRALHYDSAVVGDLDRVIAPPYDVIDAAQQDRLYASSPHNVVRLILNRSSDRYAAAAADLQAWRASGVLVRDPEPCFYYYVQDFTLADGARGQRAGLIAAVRLEAFAAGNIRPHERTFSAAKEDRLRLTVACKANLSSIFGMYPNRGDALAPARELSERQDAWIDARDEAAGRHRVWRLSASTLIDGIRRSLQDATVLIADGHHRYETALNYRERCRGEGLTDPDAPHNFVMMYLTSMDEPGLVVLPTHRVWRGAAAAPWSSLSEAFDIEEFPASADGERQLLARLLTEAGVGVLGLRIADPSRCCLLRLREQHSLDDSLADVPAAIRCLDVTVLDALVLRRILGFDAEAAEKGGLEYTHDEAEALAAARQPGAAVFLLRRPRMSEVEAVCMSGQVMPQKSTYFFPKLQSGLVFHSLERDG